jgi:hypothetical protein
MQTDRQTDTASPVCVHFLHIVQISQNDVKYRYGMGIHLLFETVITYNNLGSEMSSMHSERSTKLWLGDSTSSTILSRSGSK